MAKMIPSEVPVTTKSGAEKQVFAVLREKLDDSFTVFHSFDLLTQNKQGKFIDGEIDFLILHPKMGVLVMEVKGGTIRFDGESGTWYQNDNLLKMSPFSQAEDSKYKLEGFLSKKLGGKPDFPFGHAVCFPGVFAEMTGLPSGADPGICITGEKLKQANAVIPEIMHSFSGSRDEPMTNETMKRIREILTPQCEYGSGLKDRLGQAEQILFRLTEEQCRMIDFISGHKQALIEGCAGSGKTIMAVKKARELAAEGKSVLLLSYNILIGEQLAAAVSDLKNVTACNYHAFCIRRLQESGMTVKIGQGADFWQHEIPENFARFTEHNPIKYDAVIVDEGQDFQTEYWVTISDMVAEDGYFYIFYDPDQNIYGGDLEFPISGPPFTLKDNCRNSRSIYEKLEQYVDKEMRLSEDAPPGEPVYENTFKDGKAMRSYLGKILHDLINNKEIERERIVVLGGHAMNHTCIGENPVIGNFHMTETSEDSPNVIHYHTYMKFKGCEADAVIMIDVDPADERWQKAEALYTTISRAKHLLYILKKTDTTQ